MGLFGRLFGSPRAVEKGLEAIINTGDMIIFTDEEKAQQKIELLKAYQPFRLLQRYIVLLFTVPYVGLHSVVIIGSLHGYDWAYIGVMINEAFGYPVLAAVGLYLSGGVLPKRS
ncbi:hypothetical protein BCU68_09210 [Vibrio sp. 10N.286.49.B3]|uniref:hypothetical protein n=1 Tax=Vibrio sp. 10N.286.49.B3 TaxID=1880855 RepID=UPI000C841C32|nr:hypothetical protein [Vibrio sp. 10N.286.49.B3]PMH45963.1 hypothetical protein BCU68_09210 [Vibrio sp. 10N.286.49.B3]